MGTGAASGQVPTGATASDAAAPGRRSGVLPGVLLAYALALAVFLLPLMLLTSTVFGIEGFTLQELLDLFTPLAILPLGAAAMWLAGGTGPRWWLALLLVAIVWTEGQAIHLATNAIDDLIEGSGSPAALEGPVYDLAHWFDEVLSHWLWHIGWVGLSTLLLAAAATRGPWASLTAGAGAVTVAAGVIHGLVFGITTIEGVTALLGIPASAALLIGAWAVRRHGSPVALFLGVSSAVTLAGYAIWAALNDWTLPEFL